MDTHNTATERPEKVQRVDGRTDASEDDGPSPADAGVAPVPSLDADAATVLLDTHGRCMTAASEVLETPDDDRRAKANGCHRAAQKGHTWLARLTFKGHSEKLVQPALLGSVRPPPLTYIPAIPHRMVKSGVLSELQLEAMMYAGQCHAQPLTPSGTRHGFLLADGAGVGKGRTREK